jgi:hypothetical protein
MPAIVEADDDGMYVLKFRGAGQGSKALIAELVAGEIARAAGLPVPEIVFVELDPEMARTEPDPEIQHLIRASGGLNLALDYLPGSATFDPVATKPDEILASSVVWFDAYVSNVDRTPRNTNLLLWHRRLWLIDHGAALYFHHGSSGTGDDFLGRSRDPFPLIKDHVLLPFAGALAAVDPEMSGRAFRRGDRRIVRLIPIPGWRRNLPSRRPAAGNAGATPTRRTSQAAGSPPSVPGGGDPCASLACTTTPSSASCPRSSAGSSSTSA